MTSSDDEDMLYVQCKIETAIDVDIGRKIAGVRAGLLFALQQHVEKQKGVIKEKTVLDLCKPFSPGLWYCTKECHLDTVAPRWNRLVFKKGDPMVVLRCAGFNRGLVCSWWWVVDKDGFKHKVLWRYLPPFVHEWEQACQLPSE